MKAFSISEPAAKIINLLSRNLSIQKNLKTPLCILHRQHMISKCIKWPLYKYREVLRYVKTGSNIILCGSCHKICGMKNSWSREISGETTLRIIWGEWFFAAVVLQFFPVQWAHTQTYQFHFHNLILGYTIPIF